MPPDGGHEGHEFGREHLPLTLAHFSGNDCTQVIDIASEQTLEALQPILTGFERRSAESRI
jgi:hypothetical protein